MEFRKLQEAVVTYTYDPTADPITCTESIVITTDGVPGDPALYIMPDYT